MKSYDLSILIPARNEMFLEHTVENLLKNIRGNTEIIVVLDGYWSQVPETERVTILHYEQAIGQRAATNKAAQIATGKYLMKIDAHCVVDEGFDVKMMDAMKGHDHWTIVPKMFNLHAFDWVCKNKHRIYQGPTPEKCAQCGEKMTREIIMQPRMNRESRFYRFDKTLHFQYWGEFKQRPEAKAEIAPTLSLQGSCFMLTKERYMALNICDEAFGSWGQQGTEVACKTWLSGGEVMVVSSTWYAHMFRTQGGDFGFPYPQSGKQIEHARKFSRELFLKGKWDKAVRTLDDLLDQFRPVPDWHYTVEKPLVKPKKGVVYYTHGVGNERIFSACRKQIARGMKEKHIVSVSLAPLLFGKNIVLNEDPGFLTMAKQILAGLKAIDAEVIFFCEHDVLYHPSHFDFVPPRKDVIYYNTNVWRVRYSDGHGLFCNDLQQLSGLVAYKETLIKHYQMRVALLESYLTKFGKDNFGDYVRRMGFEPGTHERKERVDELTADNYQSRFPNIDIRHDANTTPSRWSKDQFRSERYTRGWTESSVIPGWGDVSGGLEKFLK